MSRIETGFLEGDWGNCQKNTHRCLLGMAPSLEIIYNRRNTPAVGVNVILVPNMTMWTTWLRADSGNGRTRIP